MMSDKAESPDSPIEHWEQLHEQLSTHLEKLLTCPPVADRRTIPRGVAGIYLFSENGIDLYVGRSRKLRGRILGHSKPSSKPNQAHFAVHLAREAYLAEHGVQPRRPFREDASFMRHFAEAKQRINAMDVRYVLTPNSPMDAFHAVLEIYVALVRRAKFNDFATH